MQICYNEKCQLHDNKIIDNCASETLCNIAECEKYIKEEDVNSSVSFSEGVILPETLAEDLIAHGNEAIKWLKESMGQARDLRERYEPTIEKSLAALKELEDIVEAR